MDRASKLVSLRRRQRRQLLRNVGRRTIGAENASQRLADDPPPLSSNEDAAANLNQFVSFIANQQGMRERHASTIGSSSAGVGPGVVKNVTDSTKGIRVAAEAGWVLSFDVIHELMDKKENETLRAAEELLGALSDPTTDLGVNGLTVPQLITSFSYLQRACLSILQSRSDDMLAAGNDFQLLKHEMQYEVSGAYSASYAGYVLAADMCDRATNIATGAKVDPVIVARGKEMREKGEEVLYQARARKILCSTRTLLGAKMQFDVYPDNSLQEQAKRQLIRNRAKAEAASRE